MLNANYVSDNTGNLSSLFDGSITNEGCQAVQQSQLLVSMTLLTISRTGTNLTVTSMISSAVVDQPIYSSQSGRNHHAIVLLQSMNIVIVDVAVHISCPFTLQVMNRQVWSRFIIRKLW
jgi:hypothetical protein